MRKLLFVLYVLLILLVFSVSANLRIQPVWADVNFGSQTISTINGAADGLGVVFGKRQLASQLTWWVGGCEVAV